MRHATFMFVISKMLLAYDMHAIGILFNFWAGYYNVGDNILHQIHKKIKLP